MRVSAWILCISFSLAIVFASGEDATDESSDEVNFTGSFNGGGSIIPDKAFDEWFYSFQFVRPDIELEYIYSTSDNGMQQLLDGEIDFAAISGPYTEEQAQATTPPNDLFQFPILLAPMVLVYNLPYGGMMDPTDQSADLKLILDRNVTAGIFSGRITQWREPELLAIQRPAVAALLPNATIQLVVRRDSSADTQTFQEAVRAFNPDEWRWGNVSNEWPEEFLNQSHVSAEVEAWGVIAADTLVPNSLSYVPFEEIAAADQIKYASMPNRIGDLMDYPELGTLLEEITFDPDTLAPLVSFNDDDDSWPMTSLIYIVMRKSNYKAASCSQRRDLLLFWRWALTTHLTIKRTQELGYDPIRRSDVAEVVEFWDRTIRCPETGDSLVEHQPIDQHQGGAFHVVLGIDVFALIATVVMVTVYLFRDRKSLSPSAVAYYVVLTVGSVLNYIAVVMFWRVPSSDAVCFGRQWLACIGFSMTLAGIFSRGYQVRAIQQLAASKSLSKKVHHSLIMALCTTAIVGVQLLLLGVWTAIDPFRAVESGLNESNLTFHYICSSQHPLVWWGLEITFAVSLLMFGLYVVYQTWDLKHMVRESKWISISIYNCVVVLILVTVLLSIIDVSDDGVFWIAGTATLFLTFTTITSLVLPRALKLRSMVNNNSGSNESSSNHSVSKHKESVASSPRSRREHSGSIAPCSTVEHSRVAPSSLATKLAPAVSTSVMSASVANAKESAASLSGARMELSQYAIKTSKFGSHVTEKAESPRPSPRRFSLQLPVLNVSDESQQTSKNSPRRHTLQAPFTVSIETPQTVSEEPECPGGLLVRTSPRAAEVAIEVRRE